MTQKISGVGGFFGIWVFFKDKTPKVVVTFELALVTKAYFLKSAKTKTMFFFFRLRVLSISEKNLAFNAFTAKQWSTPLWEEADMVAGKCREFNLAILTTADDVFTFLQEIHEKHSPAENDAMQVLLRTIASSKKDETEFVMQHVSHPGSPLQV